MMICKKPCQCAGLFFLSFCCLCRCMHICIMALSSIEQAIKNSGGKVGRFDEVEMLFISEELDQHGEYLSDLFVESIEEKDLLDTEDLVNNITYSQQMIGNSPALVFTFPSHGRFIEINFHKKRQNITDAIDAFALAYRITRRKAAKKKKKDTRWYTRNVYGSLNRLLSRLATNYSQTEIARLKSIIEKQDQPSGSSITLHL